MEESKIVDIKGQTLIGVLKDKYPISRGNCFTAVCDKGKFHKIVNFNIENYEYIYSYLNDHLKIRELLSGSEHSISIIHDSRVPDEWYDDRFCEVCCPERLLPLPQRLAHERGVENGSRVEKDVNMNGIKFTAIQTNYSKYPQIPTDKYPTTQTQWIRDGW